jgi:hypothetical protein
VVEEEPASGGAQRYGRGGHTSADPEHPAEQGGRDHPLQQGRLQGDVGRPDQPANGKDQDGRDGAGDGVAEQQAAGRAAAPAPADAAWLSGWYRRTGLRARVLVENDELVTRLTCPARSGMAGRVVEAVAEALGNGTWSRLRRCPDCQLVFWDRTRNASKIWCGMYAGADGRACGSIAKVRRYRARRAANGR